ncbi:MAG: hypothetical protein SFU85_06955 [Candidatus Methylacidiphilales bacterium]|nr:hypothetical protein [Candidatus Methylacidiphilales bacterium]
MRDKRFLISAVIGLCISAVLIGLALVPSSFWSNLTNAVGLGVALFLLPFISTIVGIFIAIYFYSIASSYVDAKQRGKPGWLVALFVAFISWPIGWIAWVIFRPTDKQALETNKTPNPGH